jgi:hypothetical protein
MAIPSLSCEVRPSVSRAVNPSTLIAANREGYARFLLCNVLYPRLTVALFAVLCLIAVPVQGEPLPSSPAPVSVSVSVLANTANQANTPVVHLTDWALAGGIVAGRALDWSSTEECIRRPYAQCHEGSLPNALVHDKTAFAAYETVSAAGLIYAQYRLTRMGHKRIARTLQFVNFVYMGRVVEKNYILDTVPYILRQQGGGL